MKRILTLVAALLLIMVAIMPGAAHAQDIAEAGAAIETLNANAENDGEGDDSAAYTIYDAQGNLLSSRGGQVFADDELIMESNALYRVVSVDEAAHTAIAQYVGQEPAVELAEVSRAIAAFAQAANSKASGKKLIGMYSTHSDESYIPSDGTESKNKGAGIYDVGEALKKALESHGIQVELNKTTHLPHDAGAYRRSRSTAMELVKKQPAALLDIHRDGIPNPDEYTKEIEGKKASKVRLEVGRSNPNSKSNREFAKQIKAVADKQYPGLIKDIFIGKGNYNQELYPKAILLEFGTHTISKERAIESTEFMADVLNRVLFGGTANAAEAPGQTAAKVTGGGGNVAWSGIAWIVGIALLGAVIYALVSTGSFSGMGQKLKRGTSEITGGLVGKKPGNDHDEDRRE